MAKSQFRVEQIEQVNLAKAAILFAQGAISAEKLVANVTDAELGFLSGVTSAIQAQLNSKLPKDKLSADGNVVWTDDSVAATAKAIATYVSNQIAAAQIGGAMVFKGNWSAAPTPSAGSPIAKGWTYVFDSGTAPTGLTVEAGDMLVAVADITTSAGKVLASNWTVVQSNISGAVTTVEAALTSGKLLIGGGGKTISLSNFSGLMAMTSGTPRAAVGSDLPSHNHPLGIDVGGTSGVIKVGVDVFKLDARGGGSLAYDDTTKILTINFPTIPDITVTGGAVESGKYVSGVSASGHVITVQKASLPTIPAAAGTVYVTNIVPSGTKDGTNAVFTLPENIVATTLQLFLNGQLLAPGATADYTLSGTGNRTITFVAGANIPIATDSLLASYIKA